MTYTIDLPTETEKILRERAAQSGQDVVAYIRQLIEKEIRSANGGQAQPQSLPFAPEAEVDARPWRGVFVLSPPPGPLFFQEIEIPTAQLPKWEPQIPVHVPRVATDDE